MTGSDELCWVSAAELAQRIRNGEVTPMDVAEQVVARIEAVNPEVNAFINFDRNKVLADAGRLTEAQRRGDALGPLHGVPYSIKDLTAVAGLPLTFGRHSRSSSSRQTGCSASRYAGRYSTGY